MKINIFVLFTLIPLVLSMGVLSNVQLDIIQQAEAVKATGKEVKQFGSNTKDKVCGDRLCSELEESPKTISGDSVTCTLEYMPVCGVNGKTYGNSCLLNSASVELAYQGECTGQPVIEKIPDEILKYTVEPPIIDLEKGYRVTEIANGLYWLIDGSYQAMFLTTGQGVIAIDAPEGMGQKYLDAISDVTSEPITHVIYSHIHKDHIGAAHLFPDGAVYIAHKDTAKHLKMKYDPDRLIPDITFDEKYRLVLGNQVLELSYIGPFHSKGDIVIMAPQQRVAMVVDMFHPGAGPFTAFGITKDMNAHLDAHDKLINNFDFDVLISGHEQILATKEHIKTNKEFALDVLQNVIDAQQAVDFGKIAQEYGHLGGYAIYKGYFDAIAEKCSDTTLEKWQDRLRELEPFMKDHCIAMSFYVSID